MCEAHTLPPDLAPDEAARVEAMRAEAVAEAEERAALAVRVEREVRRYIGRGFSREAAYAAVADDGRFPVSAGTAKNIYLRRRAWKVAA